MKTKKSASKRFTITSSGRIKCSAAGRRHLLTKKTTKNKRHLRGPASVHYSDARHVRAMMPYA